jgi:hypothetical protein
MKKPAYENAVSQLEEAALSANSLDAEQLAQDGGNAI